MKFENDGAVRARVVMRGWYEGRMRVVVRVRMGSLGCGDDGGVTPYEPNHVRPDFHEHGARDLERDLIICREVILRWGGGCWWRERGLPGGRVRFRC